MIGLLKKIFRNMLQKMRKKQTAEDTFNKSQQEMDDETFWRETSAQNSHSSLTFAKKLSENPAKEDSVSTNDAWLTLQTTLINRGASPKDIVEIHDSIEELNNRLSPEQVYLHLQRTYLDYKNNELDNINGEKALLKSAIRVLDNTSNEKNISRKLSWFKNLETLRKNPNNTPSEYFIDGTSGSDSEETDYSNLSIG